VTLEPTELLTLLGKATANGQAFEFHVALVLGRLLGLEKDVALRVGRRLPIERCLDLISELASLPGSQIDSSRVQPWLKVAEAANNARNRVIHSPWYGDPSTGKLQGVITKKAGFDKRSAADLQRDVDTILLATQEAQALLFTGRSS
jgi:hypothetical protein